MIKNGKKIQLAITTKNEIRCPLIIDFFGEQWTIKVIIYNKINFQLNQHYLNRMNEMDR